jgi:protein-S-isoprenylcysteine O-methyltransferase Ste14
MLSLAHITHERPIFALAYAWAGVTIMWAFWVSFIIFLAEPRQVLAWWPLPTVDRSPALENHAIAAFIDLGLVALFGMQHSVMARPRFKQWIMNRIGPGTERATYVHMANAALFLLVLCWQPIPIEIWNVRLSVARDALWFLFSMGWIVLFLGAWSFGMRELLGIEQAEAWRQGRTHSARLKTRLLYRWLRHPMYVGVLLGAWATPRMSVGHLLLALALTAYVLIALKYEERDLRERFGSQYRRWRSS